jgi:Scaffold protein Nfu/NifU N terminal
MAVATPAPTPNPNALKFTLDRRLDAMINLASADDADSAFTRAVFAAPGVASVFGTADFVTVTRAPDAPWDPIVEAVVRAAAQHL